MYSRFMSSLNNDLKRIRNAAGLSQETLARRAGVSRQAYAAMESGKATPSTEAALRLARALKIGVETLFSLPEDRSDTVQAELVWPVEAGEPFAGQPGPRRTRLVRVGSRLLARPVFGPDAARHGLVEAEGLILSWPPADNQVSVQPFGDDGPETHTLGMLGCDPAMALLDPWLRRHGVRLVWSEEGSYQALAGLARSEAHIAGCHLQDDDTGRYNEGWVRRLVPFPCTLVTFAQWQQGLIVAAGNPKEVRGVEDLAKPGVTLINRSPGSGSRSLLDRHLQRQGVETSALNGYQREASGHLAVAAAVAAGLADAGIGVRAAAQAMALGFVPLEEERYDLVIPNHFLDHRGVQVLLDLLRRPGVKRRVETLGGYDTASMGSPVSAS